jgi:hypothetical protein
MITITSQKEGFRRCGVVHSVAFKAYPNDHFSPEELAALKAEPMLKVVVTEEKPEEKGSVKQPAGKAKKGAKE